jgi:putative transposase
MLLASLSWSNFRGLKVHNGIQIDFSRPEKLTDRAFIETFNGSLRGEWLNIHWFETLAEAQRLIEAWRIDYSRSRPHMALGNNTTAESLL